MTSAAAAYPAAATPPTSTSTTSPRAPTAAPNEANNLIVLCGAHHRAVHRGELVIEGRTAEEIHFQHADASCYGAAANPGTIEVQAKVFKALCKLGFREGEVRRVLDALRRETGAAAMTAEGLLREAVDGGGTEGIEELDRRGA